MVKAAEAGSRAFTNPKRFSLPWRVMNSFTRHCFCWSVNPLSFQTIAVLIPSVYHTGPVLIDAQDYFRVPIVVSHKD